MRGPHLPISPLEPLVKLEQLRLIVAGIRLETLEVGENILSVDNAEELEDARAIAPSQKP